MVSMRSVASSAGCFNPGLAVASMVISVRLLPRSSCKSRAMRAFLRHGALMFGLFAVVYLLLKLHRALLDPVMEQPDPNQRQPQHAQQRAYQNQQTRQRPKRGPRQHAHVCRRA